MHVVFTKQLSSFLHACMKWELNTIMTYFFLALGDAKETNSVTQAENREERKQVEEEILQVNELVENTAGHTEQSGNFQINEKSVEKYIEKEENKTATGIHTIYISIIKMDGDVLLKNMVVFIL